jgi:hypothetical protein
VPAPINSAISPYYSHVTQTGISPEHTGALAVYGLTWATALFFSGDPGAGAGLAVLPVLAVSIRIASSWHVVSHPSAMPAALRPAAFGVSRSKRGSR